MPIACMSSKISARKASLERIRTVSNMQFEKTCSKCDAARKLVSPSGLYVCDHEKVGGGSSFRVFEDTKLHKKYLRARRRFNWTSETTRKSRNPSSEENDGVSRRLDSTPSSDEPRRPKRSRPIVSYNEEELTGQSCRLDSSASSDELRRSKRVKPIRFYKEESPDDEKEQSFSSSETSDVTDDKDTKTDEDYIPYCEQHQTPKKALKWHEKWHKTPKERTPLKQQKNGSKESGSSNDNNEDTETDKDYIPYWEQHQTPKKALKWHKKWHETPTERTPLKQQKNSSQESSKKVRAHRSTPMKDQQNNMDQSTSGVKKSNFECLSSLILTDKNIDTPKKEQKSSKKVRAHRSTPRKDQQNVDQSTSAIGNSNLSSPLLSDTNINIPKKERESASSSDENEDTKTDEDYIPYWEQHQTPKKALKWHEKWHETPKMRTPLKQQKNSSKESSKVRAHRSTPMKDQQNNMDQSTSGVKKSNFECLSSPILTDKNIDTPKKEQKSSKKARAHRSTPRKDQQNVDQSTSAIGNSNLSSPLLTDTNIDIPKKERESSKKARAHRSAPRKDQQNVDQSTSAIGNSNLSSALLTDTNIDIPKKEQESSKKVQSRPSAPNHHATTTACTSTSNTYNVCVDPAAGIEDLILAAPIKQESLENFEPYNAMMSLSEFVNGACHLSLNTSSQSLLTPPARRLEMAEQSTWSSDQPLYLGEDKKNWDLLRNYTSGLLQTLHQCYTLSLRPKETSCMTLADFSLKALEENHFRNVSPLSDTSPERVDDFMKASTIKASAGSYSISGETRKKLFADKLPKVVEADQPIPSSQTETDDIKESEDIVFGTPPRAVPTPVLCVLSGAKPLRLDEEAEDETPGWRAGTQEALQQDPCRTTNKRAIEAVIVNPSKRPKLEETQEEQLSDASVIQNTEESRVKRARINLPLQAKNVPVVSPAVGPNPKHLTTPLRNIQNLPELEIRCSSIRDRGCVSKIRQFMELARRTHVVRNFDTDVSRTTTHLVIEKKTTEEKTPKYLKALYNGTRVVDYTWVLDSLEKGTILPEGPYEIEKAGPPALDLFRSTIVLLLDLDVCTRRIVQDLLDFCSCDVVSSVENFVEKVKSKRYARGVCIHRDENDSKDRGNGLFQVPPSWLYLSIVERQLLPPVV